MIENITPAEFLQRRDSGELWQLLDVREQWEIETAGVEISINIPMIAHGNTNPTGPLASTPRPIMTYIPTTTGYRCGNQFCLMLKAS